MLKILMGHFDTLLWCGMALWIGLDDIQTGTLVLILWVLLNIADALKERPL